MSGPTMPVELAAYSAAIEAATGDAILRTAEIHGALVAGTPLDLVARDLRALADRITAGVDADAAKRTAAARARLDGPTLGAVLRSDDIAVAA